MPFAEATGKTVLGRKVEFIFGHAKCEKPVILVDMTHGSWRNMSGVLGEVLTGFTGVSHMHVDDITVMGLGGNTRGECNQIREEGGGQPSLLVEKNQG